MSRGPSEASATPTTFEDASRPLVLSGARITHERADLDHLEAATHDEPTARIEALLSRGGVTEAAVLQTCNRVEEYVVAETGARGREALADFADDAPDDVVVTMEHGESLRHLLRVAAGLDSQVLGEDQILGQVRETYRTASDAGALGPVLEDGLLKAIHVGERARSETAINEGIVSLGSAAVDLVERDRGFDGRTLVVGAGDVAETVLAAIETQEEGELTVLNRSPERAAALAADVGAEWGDLDGLADRLRAADVVIVSTGSASPVIGRGSLATAGETLVVDLGQPRDVAPDADALDNVAVYDLDDLRTVTRRTHEERREAATAVEAIVEEEYHHLIESYKRKRADAVVRGMYRGAERIKERELARALSKLDGLDEDERDVVRGLADAMVSRLLAAPTQSLRDAAADDDVETLLAAIELFDPGTDDEAAAEFLANLPDGLFGGPPTEGSTVSEGGED
ncbi:MAG TPA: glutamyl-tRNA reductase [Halobacteriales archaeon]|nr:glutamyl-tRNA reductase [Halobacteriales archaeon]